MNEGIVVQYTKHTPILRYKVGLPQNIEVHTCAQLDLVCKRLHQLITPVFFQTNCFCAPVILEFGLYLKNVSLQALENIRHINLTCRMFRKQVDTIFPIVIKFLSRCVSLRDLYISVNDSSHILYPPVEADPRDFENEIGKLEVKDLKMFCLVIRIDWLATVAFKTLEEESAMMERAMQKIRAAGSSEKAQ